DPTKPLMLSKDQNRVRVEPGTPLADLLQLYADLQVQNGHLEARAWRCGFTTFDNGVAVNAPLRRLYLSLDQEARTRFADPCRTGSPDSFLDWPTMPQSDEADISPFLLSLYHLRQDVASAMPDVRGQDRDAFLHWAQTDGAREMKYDPRAMGIAAVGAVP